MPLAFLLGTAGLSKLATVIYTTFCFLLSGGMQLLVIYSLTHVPEHLSFSAYLPLIRFLFCIYGSGVH
jgi:hypothetical protein